LPGAPWKNFKEFMEDAKKRPDQISIGSSGRFSSSDLPVHELMLKTGVKFNMVPFTGGGEALVATIGGHVNAVVSTPLNISPQVKAGKLRALTVFQKGRNPLFPDVLSTVESGYEVTHPIVYFVMGPKRLDKGALDTYHRVFLQVVKGTKYLEFSKENGFVIDPLGPADLTKELDQWVTTYQMLIRELKIEVKQ
jgi:tripartite-type tricarboxylate transporter receptor subunit TctC